MSLEDEEQSELNCTLWVGNLDSSVTEALLYELFAQAGPIEKIHIPKGKDGTEHKGYCFITFLNDESVPYTINVMEGTSLNGKVLKMQPRPGSKHKKAMDAAARENEQRIAVPQQQPFAVQHQIPAQGQWYIAPPHPQLAQYPNMLVYPNQILQGYPHGLANMNCMQPALVQFPPGMAPQFVNIPMAPPQMPIQHVPQEHYQYTTPRGPRPPGEYRHSRPPRPHMNGYSVHRTPNGNSAQPVASQFQQQPQVLNGSQSSQRFVQSPRGPRPHGAQRFQSQYQQQQSHQPGPRTGNNANGSVPRMPYSPRNPNHYTQQQQQQPVYTAGFPDSGGSAGGSLPYQNDRQVYSSPRQQNFSAGNNGYQFQ